MSSLEQEKKYKKIIIALSIIIPLVVAGLFKVNLKSLGFNVTPLTFLPPIYASINALTAVVLIAAVIAIKKGNKKLHSQLNTFAIGCSLLFLILYIGYHMTTDSTKFGGEGFIKYIYIFILVTHIILSIIIIPLVLITFMRAKLGNFPQHKKIAKLTFPLWLYVAITGVIVYLMISPYYT
ncbi:DUF420 domain-containing protein [Polaribacter sp.]|uniref:DUF420 domain-containing protein n=1 Tax=Polaribacter sp. TaxID=1920175 RepID=UPI003EF83133